MNIKNYIVAAVLSTFSLAVFSESAVVVGAGLAGLSAAYELEQRGYDVTVLEARDRLGGRITNRR